MDLTGGCLCGAVRYRLTGEPRTIVQCHCAMCRRASGAPVVTWVSVAPGDFVYTHGAPKTYRSSPRATRQFCAACGTPLAFQADKLVGVEVDVTVATLDDPAAVPPREHVHAESRIPWFSCDPQLPVRAGASAG